MPFKTTKNTALQYLQYRILHRILTTNSYLFKIKYAQSDKCTFCQTLSETLEHLLYQCDKITELWESIKDWILNKMNIRLEITKETVILGTTNRSDKIINWLILIVKQYIYRTRCQNKNLSIFAIQNIVKQNFEIEKYILLKNCKYAEFFTIWLPWFKLFDNDS